MKVYTKSGDSGTTALIGGQRVDKDDIRVEAYGTVDELSAFIALLGDKIKEREQISQYAQQLYSINSMLMNLEAHLAAGSPNENLPEVSTKSIEELERSIDKMQSLVPQITKFTIPGGDQVVSLCHVCRTICRRAERRSISVARQGQLDDNVIGYLNRLSDYLYLLGRTLTVYSGAEEILWIPEQK